jgi:radical SAM superfamily enzyme YgiQ (UPF0313 family)
MSKAEQRYQVKLLDLTFHAREVRQHIARVTSGYSPDIVAFSVNSFTLDDGLTIARLIRERFRHAKFIWGGIHPTLFPEEMINHPLVDGICIGEGEIPFLEFLDNLNAGRELNIPNIWHKFNGAVQRNPLREFQANLDIYPFPDWDKWEINKYLKSSQFFYGALLHLAARGCLKNCTFCSAPQVRKSLPGNFYRTRSPFSVVEEINHNFLKYEKAGMRVVSFLDSVFGLNKIWLRDFCNYYRTRGLSDKIKWHCQTRVDLIDEERVRLMKDAGCVLVDLGIESGDSHVRNQIYQKDISDIEIGRAIKILKKLKVPYRINMIVGGPWDSRDTIFESLRLIDLTQPIITRFTFYQPLPGTALYETTTSLQLKNELIKGRLNVWDYPRFTVRGMSRGRLSGLMWQLRLKKVLRAILYGFRCKGINLLGDIFNYIKNSCIPLDHPYTYLNLVDYLEQEYVKYRAKSGFP